jgi:N-acetyl-anhydromuramyl-L-alanine amidase AmpD
LRGAGGRKNSRRNPPPTARIESHTEAAESQMIPETQVHIIARQMIEKHGFEAIAMAAQNAVASERKGDAEDAKEWRHIEAAMKLMRGPNQS